MKSVTEGDRDYHDDKKNIFGSDSCKETEVKIDGRNHISELDHIIRKQCEPTYACNVY